MDPRTALHTSARRYCIEHHNTWFRRYSEGMSGGAQSDADSIYPRYLVLAAILVDVESVLPTDFVTLADLRDFLGSQERQPTTSLHVGPEVRVPSRRWQRSG